jgi:hypothetical protein
MVLLIAVLRIYYCFTVPLYTTDVLRNLGYGNEFRYYGFSVYEQVPYDFSPEIYQFFWPTREYSYPAVTLLFYAGLARIWASIVFAKLILTLLDFINAWLIHKITSDRWCALLYLCHPIGIWFVSHEGQFEALVNFQMLLAILLLQREKPCSFLLLSLAVQSKFFPILLAPYFLAKAAGHSFRFLLKSIGWGMVGLLPSVIAAGRSHYLSHFLFPGYVPINNPISWALFHPGLHAFTPFWLVLCHWIAGIVFLLAILSFIRWEQRFLPYLAPLVFVVFVKASPIGQFWYMLLTPVFCMTVENPRHRRILVGLTILFGVRSLFTMLIGPVGYRNTEEIMYILKLGMFGI